MSTVPGNSLKLAEIQYVLDALPSGIESDRTRSRPDSSSYLIAIEWRSFRPEPDDGALADSVAAVFRNHAVGRKLGIEILRQLALRLPFAIQDSIQGRNFVNEIENHSQVRTLEIPVPDFQPPLIVTYSISCYYHHGRWAHVNVTKISTPIK